VEVELVAEVHPLKVVRRQALRGRFQVVDASLGRENEQVAALPHAVGEVDVLLEGVAAEILVEALVLEHRAPVRHEEAGEELERADARRGHDGLGVEPRAHLPARFGPPPSHAEQPSPPDHELVRNGRPQRNPAHPAELGTPPLVLREDLLVPVGSDQDVVVDQEDRIPRGPVDADVALRGEAARRWVHVVECEPGVGAELLDLRTGQRLSTRVDDAKLMREHGLLDQAPNGVQEVLGPLVRGDDEARLGPASIAFHGARASLKVWRYRLRIVRRRKTLADVTER
jgi:hypothetical protein